MSPRRPGDGWRSGSGRRAPWGSVRRAAGPPAPRAAATRRAGSGKGTRLSVREATHPDIEYETHGDEGGKNGRPAIAHEGQRQSLDGHEARHHGDIVHDLEGEGRRDPRHQEGPHPIAGELGRLQHPPDHEEVEAEHSDYPKEAHSFVHNGEDYFVLSFLLVSMLV